MRVSEIQQGPFVRPQRTKYPIRQLEVGQGFIVECDRAERRKQQQRLLGCARSLRRELKERRYRTMIVKAGVILERVA